MFQESLQSEELCRDFSMVFEFHPHKKDDEFARIILIEFTLNSMRI